MHQPLRQKVEKGLVSVAPKKINTPAVVPQCVNSGNERRGYRIAEAATYMGVSPWFVELKIRSKELPALRLCRHYTILKEDMDAFLDAQRKAA